jgi:alpha-glucosidase (family GH31 glycosyl hydrolase)
METFYDYSTEKDWSPERFPVPSYARHGKDMFLPAARRMGFKLGLWLCIDYDFSYEEERRLGRQVKTEEFKAEFAEGAEVDEHFNHARTMDQITKPEEPWFEHLKDFVDQGVDWFKQDGSNQVLDHPDRLYGNGMHDDEMHNLYPLLYNRQMYEGFEEHTGRRPWVFTCAGWAGMQAHCATWTGDTGGGAGPAAACMNLSMSGHGMTGCDMEVHSKEGIHFGFLAPWAQVNSWNYFRHPWLLGEELFGVFYSYARLRYRLIPYLYSCAYEANQTGLPIMRAMPLAYPGDAETFELLSQYMLGPDLLVGVFTDRMYLPEGDWYDFWRNEITAGGQWIEPDIPDDRGGPLFVRAGAIIPTGPDVDYVGQRPDDEYTFYVYPGPVSEFELYEDDGLTQQFKDGACRTTILRQQTDGGTTSVTVQAADGTCEGAVEARRMSFLIPMLAPPRSVTLNGAELAQDAVEGAFWEWDEDLRTVYVDIGLAAADESIDLTISR